jgi:DNA-binding response OmpR family regulator
MSRGLILVVEDDDLLQDSIGACLEQDGYQVARATTGQAAIASAHRHPPDLVILDLGLPDSDGFDICRALQRDRPVPVIFLTGRSSDIDKVSGLALGDDYVTKPFSMAELEARVGAVLRRTRQVDLATQAGIIEAGDIQLDTTSHQVVVRGQPIELAPKEFDILRLLMSHPRKAFTLDEILDAIWGPEYIGAHDLVYVHINWLRQKICVDPRHPQLVQTIHGVGYRFAPEES